MAASYNRVLMMGNLTRDVEMRHTSGNQAVANFGIAMNRRFKTQTGEQREEVTFVDCEAWGRTAEVMSQYLSKGRPVFIEGRLKLDEWEDKNGGGKRSKIKVVVESFQFIDSGQGQGQGGGGGGGGERSSGVTRQSSESGDAPAGGARSGASSAPNRYEEQAIDHDDIPF